MLTSVHIKHTLDTLCPQKGTCLWIWCEQGVDEV
jgi:hypothetical protein